VSGTTCVTLKSDKTSFIGTHYSTICCGVSLQLFGCIGNTYLHASTHLSAEMESLRTCPWPRGASAFEDNLVCPWPWPWPWRQVVGLVCYTEQNIIRDDTAK